MRGLITVALPRLVDRHPGLDVHLLERDPWRRSTSSPPDRAATSAWCTAGARCRSTSPTTSRVQPSDATRPTSWSPPTTVSAAAPSARTTCTANVGSPRRRARSARLVADAVCTTAAAPCRTSSHCSSEFEMHIARRRPVSASHRSPASAALPAPHGAGAAGTRTRAVARDLGRVPPDHAGIPRRASRVGGVLPPPPRCADHTASMATSQSLQ